MDPRILAFLNDVNLLDKIVRVVQSQEVVGENKFIKTLVIVITGKRVINKRHYSTNLHPEDYSNMGKDWVTGKVSSVVFHDDWIKHQSPTPKAISLSQRLVKKKDANGHVVTETEGKKITHETIVYIQDAKEKFINDDDFKMLTECDVNTSKTIEMHSVKLEWKKPVVIVTTADTTTGEQIKGRLPSVCLDSTKEQTKKINEHQLQMDTDILNKYKNYNNEELRIVRIAFGKLKRVIVDLKSVNTIIEKKIPRCSEPIMRRIFPRLLDFIKFSAALHQYQRKTIGKLSGKKWGYDGEFDVIEATEQDVKIGYMIFNNIYKTEYADVSNLNLRQRRIRKKLEERAPTEYTVSQINRWKESGGVTIQQTYVDLKEITRADLRIITNDINFPTKYYFEPKYQQKMDEMLIDEYIEL